MGWMLATSQQLLINYCINIDKCFQRGGLYAFLSHGKQLALRLGLQCCDLNYLLVTVAQ